MCTVLLFLIVLTDLFAVIPFRQKRLPECTLLRITSLQHLLNEASNLNDSTRIATQLP